MRQPPSLTLPQKLERLHTDAYLLCLRWTAVLMVPLLYFLSDFTSQMWVPFPPAFGVVVGLNLLLSVYGMQQQAFATGRARPILIADAAQAGLATLLAGGYLSAFFLFFVLLVVELAIALPMRSAAMGMLGASALHVATATLNQVGDWTGLAATIIVGKFFALLIISVQALGFSAWVRREMQSRQAAETYARQLTTLNELFFQLNQPRLPLEQTLATLLEGAQRLLAAEMSAILVCDVAEGRWRWLAGNAPQPVLPSAIQLADWGWPVAQQAVYMAGAAYHKALPPVWAQHDLQVVAGIRLNALVGNAAGVLLIGRRAGVLNDTEWLLLRALGREAELAARNVQFQQTRQSFLSAIAHELRTPLTVLKTLLPNWATWEQVPTAQRQEIQIIMAQNLGRLEALTNDFLEATRLEAGAVTPYRKPLNLAQRVRRVLDTLKPLFRSKQQQVRVEGLASLPWVSADQRQVDQILSNLLHNAYKFAPTGGMLRIVLQVAGSAVQVCIEDNGPGVPLAAQAHIFDKFYSASAKSALAGVGLGLFICRELVLLHSGNLWYETRPAGGSRFCFTLPVAGVKANGEGNEDDPGH